MRPANNVHSSLPGDLRLPERAEQKTDDGGHGEGGHRLFAHRLVEGTLEVAGHLLHTIPRVTTLFGHSASHSLGLVGGLTELVGGFLLEIGHRVGRATIRALGHGAMLLLLDLDDTTWGLSFGSTSARGGGIHPACLLRAIGDFLPLTEKPAAARKATRRQRG